MGGRPERANQGVHGQPRVNRAEMTLPEVLRIVDLLPEMGVVFLNIGADRGLEVVRVSADDTGDRPALLRRVAGRNQEGANLPLICTP